MSDKLQQAIQATRSGDKKNAQFLLTQAIQEEPDNPQSWYLLSLLVDDEEKKKTYLTKVLDLDPEHAKAHQQMLNLKETPVVEPEEVPEVVAPVTLSSGSSNLEAQDEGETLPAWMADDLPSQNQKGIIEADTETAVVPEEASIPDWLEESVAVDWDGEKEEIEATEDSEDSELSQKQVIEEKKEIVKKEPAKSKKETSEKTYSYMLIGLVIITIIVFVILAYMIFTTI